MQQDSTIHAHESPVRKVFGDDYRFRIPHYQRPYAWEREHVTALITDLIDAQDALPDYFLGSLVLVSSHDGYHDVIDGQQRLTTLTLLFAVLAHLLPADQGQHLHPFLRQEGNPIQGLETTYRLTIRAQEREFFETYVQSPAGIDDLLALDTIPLREVERRICDNARAIRDTLQTLDNAALYGLAAYVSQHTFLVVVRADQIETAYRIFTVMNDRGLELAASDIIKAQVIGVTEESLQAKYTEEWETYEELLGRDAFSDLFSHIRMLALKRKATSSILKELQDSVLPDYLPDRPEQFVDDVVVPYGQLLHEVYRAAWIGGHASTINRHLRWLNQLDNFDWVPPVLRWMLLHRNDPDEVVRFIRRFDRLASSLFIRRVYVQPRITRYGKLLEAIDAGADVYAKGSPLELDEEEKARSREVLAGRIYGMSGGAARYILMRLDARLTDSAATWDHDVITVEHVLPQRPPDDSEWTTWFNDDERLHWTHRLANLVVLNRKRNSGASNYDFAKKKQQYFAVDGQSSPFTITNQVLGIAEWTPELLEQRQQSLIEALVDLWDLAAAQ